MVQGMNYKVTDTDCVLLLLCKMKPFVWSMQKAINEKLVGGRKKLADGLKQKEHINRIDIFFEFVPSHEDFVNNGIECEANFTSCKLF